MTAQSKKVASDDVCMLYSCHDDCNATGDAPVDTFTRKCYTGADCGFAPSFQYSYSAGNFTYINKNTDEGSFVRPWCDVGWKTVTNNTRECLSNGSWSWANWTCVEEDCYAPENITHGIWNYSSTLYNNSATITCVKGYKLFRGTEDLGPYNVTSYMCADELWEFARWEHDGDSSIAPTCELVDCGSHNISNGNVTFTNTTYLSQAKYACDYGYKFNGSGDTTRICNDLERWNGTEPECRLIDCGTPDSPGNGSAIANSTLLDQQAHYSCNIGFDLIGVSIRTCNFYDLWNDTMPTCRLVDCNMTSTPLNGSQTVTATTYNELAYFNCDDGFDLDGVSVLRCTATGEWNNTEPTCVIRDCGQPPNATDGSADYKLTTYTSLARYSCNTGYNLAGNPELRCNSSGLWDKQAPDCIIVDCGQPNTPLNGSLNVNATTYEETATFKCDLGFDLIGPDIIQCNANGAWNETEPMCTLKDCSSPPATLDGYATYNLTTYESIAVYNCYPGYNLTGYKNLTCNATGMWDNHAPTCPRVNCGPPDGVTNGSVSFNVTTFEAQALYSCDAGFDLNGISILVCNASAVWNDSSPTCDIKYCDPPPNTTHGFVQYTSAVYLSKANYSCQTGYNLTGERILTCNAFGEWDKPKPKCPIMDCGPLVNPVNGSVNAPNTTYLELATFTCDTGFDLFGPPVLSCNATAHWNDTEPTCELKDCGQPNNTTDGFVSCNSTTYDSEALYNCKVGYNLTGVSKLRCNSSGLWDNPPPTCPIMDCGEPTVPANGAVNKTGTTYTEKASYFCGIGYDLIGPTVLECNASASWNDTIPECSIKDCENPPNTTDGTVNYTNTTFESIAVYTCNVGYNLTGESNIFCNSAGIWENAAPTCPRVDCRPPAEPTNGSVSFNLTTYEARANFSCDVGFDLNGTSILECNATAVWNDSYPTCVIKDCGPPPNTTNGVVNYTSTVYLKDAYYTCHTGYYRSGEPILSCNSSGKWDKPQPECPIMDCGPPSAPHNGSVNFSATIYLELASFTCDTGFYISGPPVLFCNASALWNDTWPTCKLKGCGIPPNLTDGFVTFNLTTYKSVASYNCNQGYNLTGDSELTCNSSGEWEKQVPQCPIVDCGQPLAPTNGTVNVTATTYEGRATFYCDAGFDIIGPSILECNASALWNDSKPTCNIKDCGPPPNATDGYVDCNITTYESSAMYVCSPGYNLTGDAILICNASGMWNKPAPSCPRVNCGPPAMPDNGSVVLNDTTYESHALFKCDDGFDLQGPADRECNASAVWTGVDTACEIKDCGSPAKPTDGYVNFTSTTYLSQAVFSCNVGYNLTGHSILTCNASGLWDLPEPTCVLHDCGPPSNISNGNVNYTQTTYASLAIYECNTGYNLTGESTLACNASGEWNTTEPVCPIVDCGMPSTTLNGTVSVNNTTYEEIAVYTCDIGFYMIGSSILQCNASAHWNDSIPVCKIKECAHPQNTTNGYVNYNSTTYGSEAHYFCDNGYNLTGNRILECNASANWSNVVPVCQIVDCGLPSTPLNGSFSVQDNDTTYQRIAIFSCDAGFDVTFPSVLECNASGIWNDTEPTCQSKDCGAPSNITNGIISYNFTTFGSEAFYTCKPGYSIIEVTNLTCNATGQWDNAAPICQIKDCGSPSNITNGTVNANVTTYEGIATFACDTGFNLIGPHNLVCIASGFWNDTTPKCELKKCGHPPNITDGYVTFASTTYESNANYECNSGYNLTGLNELTCNGSAFWDPQPPVCSRVNCGLPSTPLNGSVDVPDTTYESNAIFTCDPGFQINGSSALVCNASAAWNDTEPSCELKNCGTPPNTTDGFVNYTSTTFGSKAFYSCKTGYNISGYSELTCIASGMWSNVEPPCEIVDCGALAVPNNGNVSSTNTTYLSVATYTCTTGYSLNGTLSRSCQADGRWNSTAPTCDFTDCGPPSQPVNGTVNFNSTLYLSNAYYSCNPGYDLTGTILRDCNSSGLWIPEEPVCVIRSCGNLTTSQIHGTVSTENGTTVGELAIYGCFPGYDIIGVQYRECLADATWGGEEPTCEPKDCGNLTAPPHGNVATPNGTTYPEAAVYTCNTGFVINRASPRYCQTNGSWSDTDPICGLADCGWLDHPANGRVTMGGGTTYGKTAIYTCDPGYVVKGLFSRVCMATGTWSGSNITCIDKAKAPKRIYIAPCRCSGNQTFFSNLTEQQILDYLIGATKIDETNTSLARSKLECADDPRTSSMTAGLLGVGLLAALWLFLLALDCTRVCRWFARRGGDMYRSRDAGGAAGAAGAARPRPGQPELQLPYRPPGGMPQRRGFRTGRRFSRI